MAHASHEEERDLPQVWPFTLAGVLLIVALAWFCLGLEIGAREALPAPLGTALAEEELLHQGGPVEPGSVIVLADFADPDLAAGIAFGSVGVVDPDGDLDALAEAVRAVRAFSGYAGWAA